MSSAHRSTALSYLLHRKREPHTQSNNTTGSARKPNGLTPEDNPMWVMPFSLPFDKHSAPPKQHKRSLSLRIMDAISESNRRRALREVMSVLAHMRDRLPDNGQQSSEERASHR
jgi:hypothetical protein